MQSTLRSPLPAPTFSRLWSLTWPLMLANITVPLLGLVDTAVLGHLDSPRYLGAVAIGANLFTLLYWSFGFLRMGTTGLTAQAQGAGNPDDLSRLLFQSLLLGAAIGLLILALHWPLLHIGLRLMDPSPEVTALALEYCRIRIFSAPAVLAQYAVIGWLIGRHDTRAPLYIAVATNLVNLVLNLVLVIGFGLNSAGVAMATLVAEYFALGLGLWLIHRRHRRYWHLGSLIQRLGHWPDYLELVRVNRPIFVRTLLLLLVFAFFTAQGARLGDDILAANAVLLSFLLLISNGLDGFANGAEVLVGEAVGARQRPALKASLRLSLACAAWSGLLFCLFFLLTGNWIIGLLTDLDSIADLARQYLPWLILMPLMAVWSYLLDGIFIGATQVKAMQDSMLIATLGFLLIWWLTRGLGNHGLWLAFSSFMLMRGLTLGWIGWRYTRQWRWF